MTAESGIPDFGVMGVNRSGLGTLSAASIMLAEAACGSLLLSTHGSREGRSMQPSPALRDGAELRKAEGGATTRGS